MLEEIKKMHFRTIGYIYFFKPRLLQKERYESINNYNSKCFKASLFKHILFPKNKTNFYLDIYNNFYLKQKQNLTIFRIFIQYIFLFLTISTKL